MLSIMRCRISIGSSLTKVIVMTFPKSSSVRVMGRLRTGPRRLGQLLSNPGVQVVATICSRKLWRMLFAFLRVEELTQIY